MSHKKIVGFLLGLSVLGFLVGIAFTEPVTFGLCDQEERFGCIRPLHSIGQPLFMGSFSLAVVSLILFFLPKNYLKSWFKYTAWFIPVAVLWIATSDVSCGGGLGFGACFDKELATWWSSGIFLALSALVFIFTFFGGGARKSLR